eukprot:2422888-Rhodomonas_salina.2
MYSDWRPASPDYGACSCWYKRRYAVCCSPRTCSKPPKDQTLSRPSSSVDMQHSFHTRSRPNLATNLACRLQCLQT